MKPNPWVFILFSLTMGIVIIIFPYIITLLNRFNKERVLIWRKFLIIISVCYIPLIPLLYAVFLNTPRHFNLSISPDILYPWWRGYYFGYIIFAVLVKRFINLQLNWYKFIIFATLGYLIMTIQLNVISASFDDPLVSMFAVVDGITSP